jgi:rhomboid protease GluP
MPKEPITARIETSGLSTPETVAYFLLAFRRLGWSMAYVDALQLVARTQPGGGFGVDEVVVRPGEKEAVAESRPQGWRPFHKAVRQERNLARLTEAFAFVRSSTSAEILAAEVRELEASGALVHNNGPLTHDLGWKDLPRFFIPRPGFFATPMLINISVAVYLLMVFSGVSLLSPDTEDLLSWGANWRFATLDGEWWRLFTCCFVHIGLIHLLLNMYALAMVGLYLEPLLGRWRMFGLYTITGVTASVVSLWWHENTVSAGASGAIFGLYGVLLALLLTDLIHKDVRRELLSSIGLFVVYNLFYGMKGGVDNAAHIGGLFSGLVCGAALHLALRKRSEMGLQWRTMVLPAFALGMGGYFLLRTLPGDDIVFQRRLERFAEWEQEGMAMFELGDEASGDDQLRVLEVRSGPAWDSALVLMESAMDLSVTQDVAERRACLLDYARERVVNADFVRRSLQGDTTLGPSVEASFHRLDSIVGVINAE